MTKEIEERLDRLEAWASRTFGISLAEFDSPAQAKAREQREADERKAGDKALEKAAKELDGPNDATGVPTTPKRRSKARTAAKKNKGAVTTTTATDTKGRESGVTTSAHPPTATPGQPNITHTPPREA